MKNDAYTAFITTRPIKQGEELVWDYGPKCQKVVVIIIFDNYLNKCNKCNFI